MPEKKGSDQPQEKNKTGTPPKTTEEQKDRYDTAAHSHLLQLLDEAEQEKDPRIRDLRFKGADLFAHTHRTLDATNESHVARQEGREPGGLPNPDFNGIFKEWISKQGFSVQWLQVAAIFKDSRPGIRIKIIKTGGTVKEEKFFTFDEVKKAEEYYQKQKKMLQDLEKYTPPRKKK